MWKASKLMRNGSNKNIITKIKVQQMREISKLIRDCTLETILWKIYCNCERLTRSFGILPPSNEPWSSTNLNCCGAVADAKHVGWWDMLSLNWRKALCWMITLTFFLLERARVIVAVHGKESVIGCSNQTGHVEMLDQTVIRLVPFPRRSTHHWWSCSI